MANFAGRRVAVGIALEDTRGELKEPEAFWPHMDLSFKDTTTPLYNESAYGTIVKNNDKTNTLIEGDGSINGKLYVNMLYYILALAFGQKPTTTQVEGDTGAYQHVFKIADNNEHISASVAVKDPNYSGIFSYAMPDTITINWTPDAFPTVELAFKSKKSVQQDVTVAYNVTDTEFLPKMASLRIADTLDELDDAPLASGITSFSLSIAKTLSPIQTINSGDSYESIFNTDFDVTGSIEKLYSDTTYRSYDLNGDKKAMRFELVDEIHKAGTTTPTKLTIDIARTTFDSYEPSYGLSDMSTESLNFAAVLNLDDFLSTITATLVSKYNYGAQS